MSDDKVKDFLAGDAEAQSLVVDDDLHAAIMMRVAKKAGITTAIVDDFDPLRSKVNRFLQLDWPDRRAYFRRGRLVVGLPGASIAQCVHINGPLFGVVNSKRSSKDLIRILGFPTPEGHWFAGAEEDRAAEWFAAFGRPVCLKPDMGSQGARVFPGLSTEKEFRHAFRLAAPRQTDVVIAEEYMGGSAVRFFYVRPRVIGIRIDLPANVTGDGSSTVAELIGTKNHEKKLRTGHKPIDIDDDVMRHLARQSLTLGSVLPVGQRLFVRTVSNGSKGGDSLNSMALVHPSYSEQVAAMCTAIRGFHLTAVDTKILDPSVPATSENWRILEMNSNPGVVPYYFPWEGEPQDVCADILQMLRTLMPLPG